MTSSRELISRPKYVGGTEHSPLRQIEFPCPPGTRLWIELEPEEQLRVTWDPQERHWYLEPHDDGPL